jgi:hypothetical protein
MVTSPTPPSSGASAPEHDWAADVAGRIESTVGMIRDKTTNPILGAARATVYGLMVGVMGAAVIFLVVIAVVRLADVYLPFHPVGRRVWVVDAAASAIFLLSGMFLWRRRRPRGA